MDTETVAHAMERDERTAARERWRAAGGSRRRPLHSFSTTRERGERRAELKLERDAALALLDDPECHAAWVEACILNPHLGANNAAIVAARLPGKVVGTARYWRRVGARVHKGERTALYLTGGPNTRFAPVAAFAACQTSAGPELAAIETDDERTVSNDDIPF
ncbi:MAG: hypothetical protein ACRDLD_02250 [Thermoleophilaceae bacterium]